MSDPLKHECGIAVVRLRKPLSYYHDKYGTPLWGLNKLFLLMEKQVKTVLVLAVVSWICHLVSPTSSATVMPLRTPWLLFSAVS